MIRILSIDGGGVRGILAAEILYKLESMLIARSGDESVRIADYFDMIAGTSTGGILACIYLFPDEQDNGRPKYSALHATRLYIDNAKKIFKRKSEAELAEKYSKDHFENLLREYFKDIRLSDLIKPSLITSFNIRKNSTHFFTSHDAVFRAGYDYYLWQVAMATSAAPGFFLPARISSFAGKEYELVDGGVFANNPALCAFAEARNYFGKNSGLNIKPQDLFIVSVGTGKVAGTDFSKRGIAPEYILSRESETTHFQLTQIFEAAEASDCYFRLDPYLGSAREEMDDTSDENLLALKHAGSYSGKMLEEKLERIAEKLISISKVKK